MHPIAELRGLGFPEALRWRDGELWFSDMFRSRVVRWAPGSPPETVLDRPGGGPAVPGGLGWTPDGALLVVDCEQRRVLRSRDGQVSVHADLADHLTHSANDMHVDDDGTAWVGGYGFDPDADEPRAAALVRVASDGTSTVTAERFVFANGCERDVDGALLVAETFADRVSALESSGGIRTRAVFDPGSGPDGISVSSDGTIFVALAFAGSLAAVSRRSGARPRVLYRPDPIAAGPSAGPLSVYDCAVHPDGRSIAVAIASRDEGLAMRVDTGRILLLKLPDELVGTRA